MPQPHIRGLADPSLPTGPPSSTPLQAPTTTGRPLRPIATGFVHHPEAFGMHGALHTRPRAPDGLTLTLEATLSTATPSASAPHARPAIQQTSAQDGSSGKERASDAEDFWVVFTGARPGVYQGQ